jgi:hypothetical protein
MKKLALALAFVGISSGFAGVARAEIGTADVVPAATLLLPYFEVALDDPTGANTLFSINNASATAVTAHVTLWTDEAIPTFNFDVYLTGYDVQEINLRSLFDGGVLPVTADAGSDPADTISNKGPLSQDINFPGSTGPCVAPYTSPALTAVELRNVRTAHTGRRSSTSNGCVGAEYGDLVARGYITVDAVNTCNIIDPSVAGYFTIATTQNVLWGDYTYQNRATRAYAASPLVHIEACNGAGYSGSVGNGAGLCPFAAGDYTFYGRLNGFDASDAREPLATSFATRYVNGGTLTGGTDLLVWRDPKVPPTGANGKHHCGSDPAWFPLAQSQVASFDEQENPSELCDGTTCFPLAAQRVPTASGNPIADPLAAPAPFGWLYLNLNHSGGASLTGVAQSWVSTTQSATGRFSVGYHAIALDNASVSAAGGFLLPFPP